MNIEFIKTDLKRHEGFVKHAYKDHLGFLTIGYGRLIDERRGGGISQDEAEMLLENDIVKVHNQLSRNIEGFDQFPAQVQRALINMAFQMGITGLLNFRKMLAHLSKRNYGAAAEEALNSLWARQTPNRAKEVTDWMRWAND